MNFRNKELHKMSNTYDMDSFQFQTFFRSLTNYVQLNSKHFVHIRILHVQETMLYCEVCIIMYALTKYTRNLSKCEQHLHPLYLQNL